MTHQRTRLETYISSHPGVHFNELTRALDLAPGQVQYHVRKLVRTDSVVEHHLYGRTHYYPPDYDDWERGTLALLRRETARDIVFCLLERGPSSPGTVAEDLGIARSTLEWHLDHLTERSVVEKRRDERGHVTLVLTRPRETTRLLGDVSPSLPEQMIDRFIRLFDQFLAE